MDGVIADMLAAFQKSNENVESALVSMQVAVTDTMADYEGFLGGMADSLEWLSSIIGVVTDGFGLLENPRFRWIIPEDIQPAHTYLL